MPNSWSSTVIKLLIKVFCHWGRGRTRPLSRRPRLSVNSGCVFDSVAYFNAGTIYSQQQIALQGQDSLEELVVCFEGWCSVWLGFPATWRRWTQLAASMAKPATTTVVRLISNWIPNAPWQSRSTISGWSSLSPIRLFDWRGLRHAFQ